MAQTTKIEWTDMTWNPVSGCTKVSPGCAYCYAEAIEQRFKRNKSYLPGEAIIRTHPERLDQPLHWKKARRVFVNSMSDLFHEDVPDDFIDKVFAVMALTPQHTYQVLTKRPERMLEYMLHGPETLLKDIVEARVGTEAMRIAHGRGEDVNHPWWDAWWEWPMRNIWLGVSVENQHWADIRIPLLLQTPAAVRFLSCEPLLKAVDLQWWLPDTGGRTGTIDWVIAGGESGVKARPMNPAWVRAIRDQCQEAGVPLFVKQMGHVWAKENKAGTKGGDWDRLPEDLRIREFPGVTGIEINA